MSSSIDRRNPANDADWSDLAECFDVRSGTTYLNHGSFGIAPKPVREMRRELIDRMDGQPMDFYLREFETELAETRERLGQFLGTGRDQLILAENATYAMNIVADSFPLEGGDEILLNDHEYGAVDRVWQRRCDRVGATKVVAELPKQFGSVDGVVASIFDRVTDKTRMIVCSHITSPTALIMPVEAICGEARRRGIPVCIDGPHALAQIDVDLDELDCDFYTASCHKWLCGTLGSGFLYVHPRWQDQIQPQLKSWGRLLPAMPEVWHEEFVWIGTRDPSAFLSLRAALDFMENRVGITEFRRRSFYLANYARESLTDRFGTGSLAPSDRHGQAGDSAAHQWYGSMAHVRLPKGDWNPLQSKLWSDFGIEIPIIEFDGQWFVRVSCHLYNSAEQIDFLTDTLQKIVAE